MTFKVQIYSYSACSTCRKAINWLQKNRIEYEVIDIVNNPPDKKTIRKLINNLTDKKKLFNTRGKSYRSLGADFIKSIDNEQAIQELSNDGKLIKRPLLIDSSGEILLGFNEVTWTEFFQV